METSRRYGPRTHLGAWLCEDGRHQKAEKQWRLALREAPAFLPTLVSLAQLGIDRGRPELVDEILPRLDSHPQGRVEAALRVDIPIAWSVGRAGGWTAWLRPVD